MNEVGSGRMSERRFVLTEQHVRLLRRMRVSWDGSEFGAPAIDPKRPYGNGDVLRDMSEILGVLFSLTDDWGEACPTDAQEAELRRLHRETATALQIVLATGRMEPGEYVAGRYDVNWRPAK